MAWRTSPGVHIDASIPVQCFHTPSTALRTKALPRWACRQCTPQCRRLANNGAAYVQDACSDKFRCHMTAHAALHCVVRAEERLATGNAISCCRPRRVNTRSRHRKRRSCCDILSTPHKRRQLAVMFTSLRGQHADPPEVGRRPGRCRLCSEPALLLPSAIIWPFDRPSPFCGALHRCADAPQWPVDIKITSFVGLPSGTK